MSAWKAGKVQWFDDENGKGMIVDTKNGDFYYVNYMSIDSKRKWKTLKEDQDITFKTKDSYTETFVTKVREV